MTDRTNEPAAANKARTSQLDEAVDRARELLGDVRSSAKETRRAARELREAVQAAQDERARLEAAVGNAIADAMDADYRAAVRAQLELITQDLTANKERIVNRVVNDMERAVTTYGYVSLQARGILPGRSKRTRRHTN